MDNILPSAGELTEFLKRVAVFTALGAAMVKPMVDILKVIVRNRIGHEIQGNATLLVAYAASVGAFFTILLVFEKSIEWRTLPLAFLMGFPMLGGAVLHNIGEKLSRKSSAPTALTSNP